MSIVKKLYLFGYNVFALLAWVCVAHFCVSHLMAHGIENLETFYTKVEKPLQIAQTIAILEVFNAAFGYVKSDWITATVQVLSRLHVVWIIFIVNPATHSFLFTFTCIFAWSIAEIIRYPVYALAVFDINVKPLTWLRYSGFILLYPIGIFSEVRCILHSLPLFRDDAKARVWPSAMPNAYNFQMDLYYIYLIILALYVPGSVFMYTHMVSQRGRALKKLAAPKAKKD